MSRVSTAPAHATLRPKTAPSAAPAPPRFALGWAALVYALCTLALAYPIFAGKFLVSPISDEYLAGYAFRHFGATMLHLTGHFPLWDPYLMGGVPFVGGMGGDIFYPTFILRALMPTDVAMSLAFALHLFLAGLFTYLFLRVAGLSFFASLIGGVAYMLTGFVASLAGPGHDGKLYVSTIFPLALWLITLGVRDGRNWTWGALAIAVGLAVLSPHPQLLQYMLLGTGSYALYVAVAEARSGRISNGTAVRRLAFALGAVLIGMAIGAIQFVPVLHYKPWSPRAAGLGWAHATSYSFPPEELINTYLPQFSGLLLSYWGRNGIHLHSEYLGAIVLMLAGAGLRAAKTRGFVRFWIGAGFVALLWALGGYTPFFHLIYALVPGTKFFRAPSTIFFITSFTIAVLAAFGVERVLAREIGLRYVVGWVIGAAIVGLLATAGVFTALGMSIAGVQRADFVQANSSAVTLGAWRSFLFILIGAGVLISFIKGRLSLAATGWLLVVATAADFWTIERHYWIFSPPASAIYASNAAVDYVIAQNKKEQGRVYTPPPLAAETPLHDPYISGDALMVHGVREITGYHNNELARYQDLYNYNGGGMGELQRILGTPNFWRLTNMKYVLTDSPKPLTQAMTKVMGPVKDAVGTPLYLYSVAGDNPPAWITPIIVKAPDPIALSTILDSRFDVGTAAIFDTAAAVQGQQVTTVPAPLPIKAKVTRYDPGHITVQLDSAAPAGSALMVSENYYPGWQATADGRPATVGRADYVLIGVALPTGARSIDLTFHSAPYETGKTITLVAIVLSVLVGFAGAFADRRRRA